MLENKSNLFFKKQYDESKEIFHLFLDKVNEFSEQIIIEDDLYDKKFHINNYII